MKRKATPDFWNLYNALPQELQRSAQDSYELLKENPQHPSLQFKKVGAAWSVRINRDYRALAIESEPEGGAVDAGRVLNWFWIGPHNQYDKKV